jgi:hypothetical protein
MSLGMAISNFKGVMNTIKSEDLSIFDKFTSTLTSGSFALMSISRSFTSIAGGETVKALGKIGLGANFANNMKEGKGLAALRFGANGTEIGTTAAGGLAALGTYAAIVTLLIGAGAALENAIVTPKERLDELTQSAQLFL